MQKDLKVVDCVNVSCSDLTASLLHISQHMYVFMPLTHPTRHQNCSRFYCIPYTTVTVPAQAICSTSFSSGETKGTQKAGKEIDMRNTFVLGKMEDMTTLIPNPNLISSQDTKVEETLPGIPNLDRLFSINTMPETHKKEFITSLLVTAPAQLTNQENFHPSIWRAIN